MFFREIRSISRQDVDAAAFYVSGTSSFANVREFANASIGENIHVLPDRERPLAVRKMRPGLMNDG